MGSREDPPGLHRGTYSDVSDARDDVDPWPHGPPGLSGGPHSESMPSFPPPLPPLLSTLVQPSVPLPQSTDTPAPRPVPARHDLVRQVADEVVQRSDAHTASLLDDFVEKGRATMKVFQQEQVERVTAIRGKLEMCTESYTQLQRDNESLRTNLETIVRHIHMLHWASPAAQWATQGPAASMSSGVQGGMQGGMQPGMPYYHAPTASRQDEYDLSSVSPEHSQPRTHRTSKASTKANPKPTSYFGAAGPTVADLRAGVGPTPNLQFEAPERKATPTPALEHIEEGSDEEGSEVAKEEQGRNLLQEAGRAAISVGGQREATTPEVQQQDSEREEARNTAAPSELLPLSLPPPTTPPTQPVIDPSTPPRAGGSTPQFGYTPVFTPPIPTPAASEEFERVSSAALAAFLREGGKPSCAPPGFSPGQAAGQTPSTAEPKTPVFSAASASPTPSSPGSAFSLTLRRVEGMPLGLEVKHDDIRGDLHVDRVQPGTVADSWNRQCNDHRELMKGDRLVSVNGATDPADMREECLSKLLLKIEVVREAPDSGDDVTCELDLYMDEP